MNLNTSYGAGAIDLQIASAGAEAWSILGQLPSPANEWTERESERKRKRSGRLVAVVAKTSEEPAEC